MKIKCSYCDAMFEDTLPKCPYCNGVNNNVARMATGVPTTIAELKKYCEDRHMPLEKMRFFIGENYYGARAFGIYHDTSRNVYIVYKNKGNGDRVVRYEGDDEAYAVNEIYQKLRTEIGNQAEAGSISRRHSNNQSQSVLMLRSEARPVVRQSVVGRKIRKGLLNLLLFLIIMAIAAGTTWFRERRDSNSYYNYNGSYYYNDHRNGWYRYDPSLRTWVDAIIDSTMSSGLDQYQSSKYEFNDDYGYDSAYGYDEDNDSQSSDSWDNDWDDDYDWDFSGWDSDITDWDTDW